MQWRLVCAGVLIHLILVYSIFDIYYTSPIVTDVPAHEITRQEAPSKRLVVITADGLRMDTFSRNPDKSPFLHSLIRERKV
ncbi:hypothetical protein ANCCAN_28793 [Ancylostoma caninum]|uniref:GPI ethanolamine phosphate transferase 1 n=1 Tax=Ancylostoma caninum TaxID=29170 RepID=A0A368F094_ANCCA|nr:hypothetical protein ANCCAN_28793 [Ancylostoma caninum]